MGIYAEVANRMETRDLGNGSSFTLQVEYCAYLFHKVAVHVSQKLFILHAIYLRF